MHNPPAHKPPRFDYNLLVMPFKVCFDSTNILLYNIFT